MPTLVIHRVDDERIDFRLDDSEICSVNHDEDGWSGMEKVQLALETVAELEGWEVMYFDGEEDE